jgi:hypothetical protein
VLQTGCADEGSIVAQKTHTPAPQRRNVDAIVVACFKRDLFLLRSCVASIRYWYPEIEIYLLKDHSEGEFSTGELEQHFGVQVFKSTRHVFGWPWSKLEVILRPERRKYLFLDSDTVLLGPVLELLNACDADFVVTGIRAPADSDNVSANYIDMDRIRGFDADYQYPGFAFNGGQLVMTSGMLTAADLDPVVQLEPEMANRHPEIFKHGDQGALNYVFAKAHQAGRITLEYVDFWLWPGMPEARSIPLARVESKSGIPLIMHWAGVKPTDFRKYLRYDILQFYTARYYDRVPLGRVKQRWRHLLQVAFVRLRILKYTVLGMDYE